MSRFLSTTVLMLLLVLPLRATAMDAETAQLERHALCTALPWRCPDGPGPAPAPDPTDVLCTRLAQSPERGTAAAVENDRLWQTSCHAWQERQDTKERQAAARRAIQRDSRRYSSTIDCLTTWEDGRYSSRLTTTCTSY